MAGRPIPRRRQPGIEVTRPRTNVPPPPPSSPSYAFDLVGDAMGNVLGKAGQVIKGARDLAYNELLGFDDFGWAAKNARQGNWGEAAKSAGAGLGELGLTLGTSGVGTVGKGIAKVGAKALGPLPPWMSGANVIPKVGQTFPKAVAKVAAPMLAGSLLFSGGLGTAASAIAHTGAPIAAMKVIQHSGDDILKGITKTGSDIINFGKGAVDDVVDVGKNLADNAVGAVQKGMDTVKTNLGLGANTAKENQLQFDDQDYIDAQQLKPYNQEQQQQQYSTTLSRPLGPSRPGRTTTERPDKTNKRIPNLPDFKAPGGIDVDIPYTY